MHHLPNEASLINAAVAAERHKTNSYRPLLSCNIGVCDALLKKKTFLERPISVARFCVRSVCFLGLKIIIKRS